LLDPEYHEKGAEKKYGHGPQVVVEAQGFAAEEFKKGTQESFAWFYYCRFSGLFNRRIFCHTMSSPSCGANLRKVGRIVRRRFGASWPGNLDAILK
jgi:hypothetical protein